MWVASSSCLVAEGGRGSNRGAVQHRGLAIELEDGGLRFVVLDLLDRQELLTRVVGVPDLMKWQSPVVQNHAGSELRRIRYRI